MINLPKYTCYTDASYSNQSQNKIGVIYYMIYIGDELIY
jgi:hypothetical protein